PELLGGGANEGEQLVGQLGDAGERLPIWMEDLCGGAEAKRAPAILRVVTAIGGSSRAGPHARTQRLQQRAEGHRNVEARGLVRHANLERSEARMRSDVPPETCVVVRERDPDQPLDKGLPRAVRTERRRRSGPW